MSKATSGLLLSTWLVLATGFRGNDSPAPPGGIGQEQPAGDLYGDPLPPNALARMGTTRFRQGTPIVALVFSPDAKTLASVEGRERSAPTSNPLGIQLWDTTTGKPVRRLEAPQRLLWRAGFSSDGTTVSALGENTVCTWDAATGKEVRRFKKPGQEKPSTTSVMSADGTMLAGRQGNEPTIHVWDTTGKVICQLAGHGLALPIGFSADNKTFISGSYYDNTFRFWNIADGKEIRRLPQFGSASTRFTVSPDASVLTTWEEQGSIQIWDVESGNKIKSFAPGEGIESVAVSPNRKVAAAGMYDGTVKLWDVDSGDVLLHVRAHPTHVGCLCFSADSRILASAGRFEYAVRLWDVTNGRELARTGGHQAPVTSLDISSDGKFVVTASSDQTARFWDLATGKEMRKLHLEFDHPAIALSPDGKTLATGGRRLLDATTGQEIRRFEGDRMYYFNRLAFAPDGTKLIGGGAGEGICLWEVATGRVLREFPGGEIRSVAFAPDGNTLAVGQEESVEIWDMAADQSLLQFGEKRRRTNYQSGFTQLAFSPDGRLLAAPLRQNGSRNREPPRDGGIRVYEAATGKLHYSLDGHQGYVTTVAFSPDGRVLASGGADHTVRLWDTATGKERHVFRGHAGSVTSVAFTPDGRYIVSASTDATAIVWEVSRGGGP